MTNRLRPDLKQYWSSTYPFGSYFIHNHLYPWTIISPKIHGHWRVWAWIWAPNVGPWSEVRGLQVLQLHQHACTCHVMDFTTLSLVCASIRSSIYKHRTFIPFLFFSILLSINVERLSMHLHAKINSSTPKDNILRKLLNTPHFLLNTPHYHQPEWVGKRDVVCCIFSKKCGVFNNSLS